jgi:peptidoglycan/xylan/chitin deacetylase (PgdA/CDA1 family)
MPAPKIDIDSNSEGREFLKNLSFGQTAHPIKVEPSTICDDSVRASDERHQQERTSEVPILMYHSVADNGSPELTPYRVGVAAFQQQICFLRRQGYHSIPLDEWARCIVSGQECSDRQIIITFDDGYKNFITHAAPILEAAGFRATIFVVTDKVGGTSDWDAALANPIELMNWNDLRALQQRGFDICSHTTSHVDLLTLSDEDIIRDSSEARAALHKQLGREVTSIAFPWGRSDARVRAALVRGGFRVGFSVNNGFSSLRDDLLNLPRIHIAGPGDLDDFVGRIDTARIETHRRHLKLLNDELVEKRRLRQDEQKQLRELEAVLIGQSARIDRLETDLSRYNSRRYLIKSLVRIAADRLGRADLHSKKRLRADILKSGLFDPDYYRGTYEDVAAAGFNPLEHYLAYGWNEGRDPSAIFSTRDYLALHDDVRLVGVNPLVHYVRHGQKEGRAIKATAATTSATAEV